MVLAGREGRWKYETGGPSLEDEERKRDSAGEGSHDFVELAKARLVGLLCLLLARTARERREGKRLWVRMRNVMFCSTVRAATATAELDAMMMMEQMPEGCGCICEEEWVDGNRWWCGWQ